MGLSNSKGVLDVGSKDAQKTYQFGTHGVTQAIYECTYLILLLEYDNESSHCTKPALNGRTHLSQ